MSTNDTKLFRLRTSDINKRLCGVESHY